jgi:putative flippase GtrA
MVTKRPDIQVRRQVAAVSTISGLYERFRHLIHEGAKFLVIGAIGTVVTFGLANGLKHIGEYKAVTIATIAATVVTYLGNRYWTFKDRQGQGTTRDSVVFFVLNGIGLLIFYACIGVTELAGVRHDIVWYNVALVVGTGLGTLFRFWSYRKWVWVAADTPVLAAPESDEDRAQDLAAMVGAAPITHHGAGAAPINHRASGTAPINHRASGAAPIAHHASGERAERVPGRPRTPGAHRRSS